MDASSYHPKKLYPCSVSISPDGLLIAATAEVRDSNPGQYFWEARVWDLNSRCIAKMDISVPRDYERPCIAFLQDNTNIALFFGEHSAVYNLPTTDQTQELRRVCTLTGHAAHTIARSICVSDRWIAASTDLGIYLWNKDTGLLEALYHGPGTEHWRELSKQCQVR